MEVDRLKNQLNPHFLLISKLSDWSAAINRFT